MDEFRTDDARTREFYAEAFRQYGPSVQSLGWSGGETQLLRFRKLTEVGPMDGASLLDVGCGLGDLNAWLKEQGSRTHYTGIDSNPDFVRITSSKFPDATVHLGEFLDDLGEAGLDTGRFDYVVASGIFTFRTVQPAEYLAAAVQKMFRLARIGVAFNVLSTWGDFHRDTDFEAEPADVLSICRRFTRWIVLRHDYHPRDFTVYLYHQARG